MCLHIFPNDDFYPDFKFVDLRSPMLEKMLCEQFYSIVSLQTRLLIKNHVKQAILEILFYFFRNVISDQHKAFVSRILSGFYIFPNDLSQSQSARPCVGKNSI